MGCSGGGKFSFVKKSMERFNPSLFQPHPKFRASSDCGPHGWNERCWGPYTRRPGPTGPDGALGRWGSIRQATWPDVREAAVLSEGLHRPPDAVMRRREEEVV